MFPRFSPTFMYWKAICLPLDFYEVSKVINNDLRWNILDCIILVCVGYTEKGAEFTAI